MRSFSDLTANTVWQSHRAISREAYEALVLPANLRRVGIGKGVMDARYFRRSPGAAAGGEDLRLPPGWVLRTRLQQVRMTIHLPNPTAAFFIANGASVQGPVDPIV